MKKLTPAFSTAFIAILIAACSSSTAPEPGSQYPFFNQTWKVESAELADWQGVQGAAQMAYNKVAADTLISDTLYIEHPNVRDLKLYEATQVQNKGFVIKFIDNEIGNIKNRDVVPTDTLFGEADFQFSTIKLEGDSTFIYKYAYNFYCGKSYTQTDTLFITVRNISTGDTAKVYAFNVAGALKSVNHIVCGSN